MDKAALRGESISAAAPIPDRPGDTVIDYDAFVGAFGSRLLRMAVLLAGDARAGEDLLQDTLLRVWQRWSRVSSADSPYAYVHRMLVTGSVSRWRSLGRHRAGEHLVAEPPDRADTTPAARDDALWAAVASLPTRQRAVMVLTYYEDCPDSEIAALLGVAAGTVKSQRAKALKGLRRRESEIRE